MDNKLKWGFPLFLFAAILAVIWSGQSQALSDPLGTFRSFEKSCGTTAAPLCSGANCKIKAGKFWVNSATPVYMGGSDVNTGTLGMPYCTDTATCVAASEPIDGNLNGLWCKAGSSVTVDIIVGN